MKKPLAVLCAISLLVLSVNCSRKEAQQPTAISSSQLLSAAKKGQFTVYNIPANAHYCKPNPTTFITASKLVFNAVFDSSCIYTLTDYKNRDDVNKLYGFSDCGTHHLENSARVGWRWSQDSLRLFAFVHNDGEMLIQQMTTANIGDTIPCSIQCSGSNYIFTVKGITVNMPRHCSKNNFSRYKLYPYFGGDEVAPHAVKISISEL